MTDPLLPEACQVKRWEQHSADVFTLELTPPRQYRSFSAGQFNMLYMPGAGESAISISGNPAQSGTLVHTIRAVGNVTRLLERQKPLDRIGIRGPFGRGWPVAAAEGKTLLLLAGGIGLAPLRPVLYEALARRERFRGLSLLVGARTPADILYQKQLLDWKATGDIDLQVTVDTADSTWPGDVGVITRLVERLRLDPSQTVAMICGPEIMMRFCVRRLREMGMAPADIYVSLERNMKCAVGFCGHCQLGPHFLCKDGPVFSFPEVESYLMTREF